jgi:hypothetical protein
MTQFKDIKSRIVLVDYFPGYHGHFFCHVLHTLIYDVKDAKKFQKNYHNSSLVPKALFLPESLECPMDNVPFTAEFFLSEPNLTQKIFYPMHWSNYWFNKINSGAVEDPAKLITQYPMVEISANKSSWFRCFINYWFNIHSTHNRDNISNNSYFVDNFYDHANCVQHLTIFETDTARKITQDPATHKFTAKQVVDIFESAILRAHQNCYDTTQACNASMLTPLNLPNTVYQYEFENFYDFDKFASSIEQLKEFFSLNFKLDMLYLRNTWDNFIQTQFPIRVNDPSVPDQELHVIEQAYKNFLKQCP